jgi:tRNA(fMet)-specific endonuclease VapC
LGVVLDSTVWIAAERRRRSVLDTLASLQSSLGDEIVTIAVMTAAELVHGVWRATPAATRAQREDFVEEIFARVPLYPFSLRIARIIGHIDAVTRSAGKTIPTADLIVGATAMDLGFSVATANERHYRLIPGLRVLMLY